MTKAGQAKTKTGEKMTKTGEKTTETEYILSRDSGMERPPMSVIISTLFPPLHYRSEAHVKQVKSMTYSCCMALCAGEELRLYRLTAARMQEKT